MRSPITIPFHKVFLEVILKNSSLNYYFFFLFANLLIFWALYIFFSFFVIATCSCNFNYYYLIIIFFTKASTQISSNSKWSETFSSFQKRHLKNENYSINSEISVHRNLTSVYFSNLLMTLFTKVYLGLPTSSPLSPSFIASSLQGPLECKIRTKYQHFPELFITVGKPTVDNQNLGLPHRCIPQLVNSQTQSNLANSFFSEWNHMWSSRCITAT